MPAHDKRRALMVLHATLETAIGCFDAGDGDLDALSFVVRMTELLDLVDEELARFA